MLRDRISALRTANIYEPQTYRHVTGALRLLARDGGETRTESNFTVTRTMADGEMTIFACGKYLDRIVEDGGALRFAERLAVLDSRRIDTLLVMPI
jgi:anthranilate 1,2-dioxygenase small subunit